MIIIEFLFLLILFSLCWLFGFWCGTKYGTIAAVVARIKTLWGDA